MVLREMGRVIGRRNIVAGSFVVYECLDARSVR